MIIQYIYIMKYLIQLLLLTVFIQSVNGQSLLIDSNPKGALVTCDGKNIGSTPFMYEIKQGDQILKFIHPDSIHTRTVNLKRITSDIYNFNTKTILVDFVTNKETVSLQIKPAEAGRQASIKKEKPAKTVPDSNSYRAVRNRLLQNQRFAVSLQISALLIGDLELSTETRLKKKCWIGVSLGYKPKSVITDNDIYNNHNNLNSNGPIQEIMFMPFSESYYASANFKYYFYKFFYVNAELFDRNTKFDRATIKWDDKYDPIKGGVAYYSDQLSANLNAYGIKITPGFRYVIPCNEHVGFTLDVYGGIGFRYRNIDLYHYNLTTTYSSYLNKGPETEINKSEKYTISNPSLHLGFKIGIVF